MKFSEVTRFEVIKNLEEYVGKIIDEYANNIEDNWQPGDILPGSTKESFFDEVKMLQQKAAGLNYDLVAVIVGDTITEEALPTYEAWLYQVDGMKEIGYESNWNKWIRFWTAEENRHGDILNKYLYLSGRVNMAKMEASTQYLIADGFNIKTGDDPYKSFVYTSFQEIATNISHRRAGTLAKKDGDNFLAKICGLVAADEARHAKVYSSFVSKIFEIDPSEMMTAFEKMMRNKIVMPAHFLRELGNGGSNIFGHFSDAAQRLGVYTAQDYSNILTSLVKEWNIENIRGLNETAEKAREYLVNLPGRLNKIVERLKIPQMGYKFSWIA